MTNINVGETSDMAIKLALIFNRNISDYMIACKVANDEAELEKEWWYEWQIYGVAALLVLYPNVIDKFREL